MTMQRQLDQVASGQQKHVKLSNPLYLFTQRYLSQLVRDSSLSPPKRQLLYTHLQNYAKRLPFYINRPLQRAEQGTQNKEANLNPPIVINDDDYNNNEPRSPSRRGRSKQLSDVIRQLRSQRRATPSSIRREVKEEVKKEDNPTPSWLSRLRQRQAERLNPINALARREERGRRHGRTNVPRWGWKKTKTRRNVNRHHFQRIRRHLVSRIWKKCSHREGRVTTKVSPVQETTDTVFRALHLGDALPHLLDHEGYHPT